MLGFFTLQCHQNLGDMEKAKEWLRKSLELPAKDYDVIFSLFFARNFKTVCLMQYVLKHSSQYPFKIELHSTIVLIL